MVSKYDVHWVRVKAGHYRMMPNSTYDIFKRSDGWEVIYNNLWTNTKDIVGRGLPTYSAAKKVAMKDKNDKLEEGIRVLGRRR